MTEDSILVNLLQPGHLGALHHGPVRMTTKVETLTTMEAANKDTTALLLATLPLGHSKLPLTLRTTVMLLLATLVDILAAIPLNKQWALHPVLPLLLD